MDIIIENNKDLFTNVKLGGDYCIVTIPQFNNMVVQFNEQYISCLDIEGIDDKDRFISKINIR